MKYQYLSLIGMIETVMEDGRVLSIGLTDGEKIENEDIKINKWFDIYFNGKDPGNFPYPLKDIGSDFEKKLRKELLSVGFGEIISYKGLAERISERMSYRAVGHGLNRNPFMIAVPCHRVIGSDYMLVGFAPGNDKKKILLENEGHSFEKDKLIR